MTSSDRSVDTRHAWRPTAAVWLRVFRMSCSSSLKFSSSPCAIMLSRELSCIRQDRQSCQALFWETHLLAFDYSGLVLGCPCFNGLSHHVDFRCDSQPRFSHSRESHTGSSATNRLVFREPNFLQHYQEVLAWFPFKPAVVPSAPRGRANLQPGGDH